MKMPKTPISGRGCAPHPPLDRRSRSAFRDIDRRLADIEMMYTSQQPPRRRNRQPALSAPSLRESYMSNLASWFRSPFSGRSGVLRLHHLVRAKHGYPLTDRKGRTIVTRDGDLTVNRRPNC